MIALRLWGWQGSKTRQVAHSLKTLVVVLTEVSIWVELATLISKIVNGRGSSVRPFIGLSIHPHCWVPIQHWPLPWHSAWLNSNNWQIRFHNTFFIYTNKCPHLLIFSRAQGNSFLNQPRVFLQILSKEALVSLIFFRTKNFAFDFWKSYACITCYINLGWYCTHSLCRISWWQYYELSE